MDAIINSIFSLIKYCVNLLFTNPISKKDKIKKIFAYIFLLIVILLIVLFAYFTIPEFFKSNSYKTKEEKIELCEIYYIRGDINLSTQYRNNKFYTKFGTEKVKHEFNDDLITFYIPSKTFKNYNKLILYYDNKLIKRIKIPSYNEFKIDNLKNICTVSLDEFVIDDTNILNVIENFSDVLNKKLDSIKFSQVKEDLKPFKKTEPETLVKKEVVQKSNLIANGQIIAGSVLLNKKSNFHLPKGVNFHVTYFAYAHESVVNSVGGDEYIRIREIESKFKNIALKSGSTYEEIKVLTSQGKNGGCIKIEY